VLTNFRTNFVIDCLNNLFKFSFSLIDVTRNCPNEFKAIKKTRKSLLDCFKVPPTDVFKLAFKSGQELHKIFCFCVLLWEFFLTWIKVFKAEVIRRVLTHKNWENSFYWWHSQLLVKHVELSGLLRPVLSFSGRCFIISFTCTFLFSVERLLNF